MKAIITILLLVPLSLMNANTLDESSDNKSILYMNPTENSIRVMSFNLRLDTPSDGPNAWPYRKEMVAQTMRFHQADFVGIQEGLPYQLIDLDKLLPYFDRIGVGRKGGSDEGEYSAIYYKKDRFELLEDDTFWLSETPDEVGSVGWDAALPRIVTWGKFSDNKTGKIFFTFNTHFDHIGELAREESAALILEKIQEIAADMPVVLTGDFNTTENDDPYKVLTGEKGGMDISLEDGFYAAEYGHYGPTSTWNGFKEIVPDRRIDFIFTNGGFDVIQHAILADHQDGRFPSDHLPVAADIEVAED